MHLIHCPERTVDLAEDFDLLNFSDDLQKENKVIGNVKNKQKRQNQIMTETLSLTDHLRHLIANVGWKYNLHKQSLAITF